MKTRLSDCFRQHWNEKISNSDNFSTFYSFKSFITPELYLNDNNFGRALRNIYVKFRLGVSKINCHRYKFYKNKSLLKCPFCSCENESEYHVLYECCVYSDLRVLLPVQFREMEMKKLLCENMYGKYVARYLLNMFKRRDERLDGMI